MKLTLDQFLVAMGFRFSDKTEYLATHPEARASWLRKMAAKIERAGKRHPTTSK